jgi:hypothetical protein
MGTQNLSVDSPALLLVGLLLLWFYTVWQSYVIEETRARLEGLQEIWRETLSSDPAWRYGKAARIVQHVLVSIRQRLPQLSLTFLVIALLAPSRERSGSRVQIYDELGRPPSNRLQREATSIVDTAARYVVLAALKRSLFLWALAPLLLCAFIVWSAHWQLRILLEGAPQAWLQLAQMRLRRKILAPLVGIVSSEFAAYPGARPANN